MPTTDSSECRNCEEAVIRHSGPNEATMAQQVDCLFAILVLYYTLHQQPEDVTNASGSYTLPPAAREMPDATRLCCWPLISRVTCTCLGSGGINSGEDLEDSTRTARQISTAWQNSCQVLRL